MKTIKFLREKFENIKNINKLNISLSKRQKAIEKYLYILPVAVIAISIVYVIVIAFTQQTNNVSSEELLASYGTSTLIKEHVMGEEYSPNKENNETPIYEDTPITMYGDSFCVAPDLETLSVAANVSRYTNLRLVYNVASPNDTVEMVGARTGGIPMYVSPCDIPARKNNVEISITNEYGTDIYPDLSKNAGLNPCRIDGIEGVIAESDDKLVFSRAKSGDEVIITDDDVIIETRAMDLRLEDITVFFVGSDSIYADADKTIEYYDKILASLKTDKYLIVGPVTGSHNVINDINEVLSEEYGDKYFNIFEFLCTDAIDQERMIFTDEELENAENRIEVPKAFLSENLNSFNSEGSDIVGRRIAEILDELGYLE